MPDSDDPKNQLAGLPMEALIGGPLQAAIHSNVMVARATSDFINTIGAKSVDFKFDRIEEREMPDPDDPDQKKVIIAPVTTEMDIRLPLIAIVPVPNLQIETVDITFDMEVKSHAESHDEGKNQEARDWTGGTHYELHGVASAHRENTRSTDTSAKYHMEISAAKQPLPEALARVLDMMAASVTPQPESVGGNAGEQDATEQQETLKRLEAELLESEQKLAEIHERAETDKANQCIAILDSDIQCKNVRSNGDLCEAHSRAEEIGQKVRRGKPQRGLRKRPPAALKGRRR